MGIMASKSKLLRSILEAHPDGLTTQQVAQLSGLTTRDARRYFNTMRDVEVIGDVPGRHGQRVKIWRKTSTNRPELSVFMEAKLETVDPTKPRTRWVGGVPKWKWV